MRTLGILTLAALIGALSPPVVSADKTAEPKTREVKVDALKLTVPVAWKQMKPSNRLRKAQFEVPAVKGDAGNVDLVIYEFSGGGGGVGANITRWIKQFQAKGRKAKITRGEAPQGRYVFVDITGTYNKPIGPPIRRMTKALPDARMLAVILVVTKARKVYYLKFAGGAKTVSANAAAIRASFGADASKEKELKLPAGG
ncbi:MAG: hypothetical protein ACE5KM_13695 [Planctomycetaceae bacterium]